VNTAPAPPPPPPQEHSGGATLTPTRCRVGIIRCPASRRRRRAEQEDTTTDWPVPLTCGRRPSPLPS